MMTVEGIMTGRIVTAKKTTTVKDVRRRIFAMDSGEPSRRGIIPNISVTGRQIASSLLKIVKKGGGRGTVSPIPTKEGQGSQVGNRIRRQR